MRLWTFQPYEVFEKLQNGQIFRCDANKSELIQEFEFKKSYDFMVESMKARLTHSQRPFGVKYPIWAWHTAYGAHKRPDRRFLMFNNRQEQHLIEIEVSSDRVLLSDFDGWHHVLNGSPLLPESFYEKELDSDDLYNSRETMSYAEIKTTWEDIFDVQRKEFIQASLWEVRPEDVVKYW